MRSFYGNVIGSGTLPLAVLAQKTKDGEARLVQNQAGRARHSGRVPDFLNTPAGHPTGLGYAHQPAR
ncbi:MAG: hypothetical protein ACRC1E_11975 [Craterilacuibacter sp.]